MSPPPDKKPFWPRLLDPVSNSIIRHPTASRRAFLAALLTGSASLAYLLLKEKANQVLAVLPSEQERAWRQAELAQPHVREVITSQNSPINFSIINATSHLETIRLNNQAWIDIFNSLQPDQQANVARFEFIFTLIDANDQSLAYDLLLQTSSSGVLNQQRGEICAWTIPLSNFPPDFLSQDAVSQQEYLNLLTSEVSASILAIIDTVTREPEVDCTHQSLDPNRPSWFLDQNPPLLIQITLAAQ